MRLRSKDAFDALEHVLFMVSPKLDLDSAHDLCWIKFACSVNSHGRQDPIWMLIFLPGTFTSNVSKIILLKCTAGVKTLKITCTFWRTLQTNCKFNCLHHKLFRLENLCSYSNRMQTITIVLNRVPFELSIEFHAFINAKYAIIDKICDCIWWLLAKISA